MHTDQLAARLQRLESSHARCKRLATVLGLLLAATFAGAMDEDEVPEVIRAKRFEVIGEAGPVLRLFENNAGGAGLTMLNKAGTEVVSALTFSTGSRFQLCNGVTGEPVAMIDANNWRGGHVWVGSGEGSGGVSIATSDAGGSIEVRADPHRVNRSRILIEATSDGGAFLIRDTSESVRLHARVTEGRGGEIDLSNRAGQHRVLDASDR